jgi:hypothetical protein
MTVKDELLIFWICFVILIVFLARHLLDCAAVLMQHMAGLFLFTAPVLLRLFTAHGH